MLNIVDITVYQIENTWILYGLLAVALYIYHIYYNNTLFALFFSSP